MVFGRAAAERGEARLRRLLEAPIGPVLAGLAAPNVAFVTVQMAQTVMDAWYVGHLGLASLAALALVFPVQALMQMMSAGAMGGGVSSAIARALGADDRARAEALVLHALLIALAMAALYTLLFAVLARPLFALLGGTAAALDGAVAYAEILFGAAGVIWLANTLASVLRGTGNMLVPGLTMVVTTGLGIVASGALTLGWWGVPAMGVRGPALAFVGVHVAATAVMFAYLVCGRAGLQLRLLGVGLRRRLFDDILRVGVLGCVNSAFTIGTIVIVTGLVGQYGTAALAGYGLGSRLEIMLVPLSFGVGSALTAMVGVNRGAGRHARARRVALVGGIFVMAATGSIGLVAALRPELWIGLFTADPDALAVARDYLVVVGPAYGLFGLAMALYFATQGTGSMIVPVLAGGLRPVISGGLGALAVLWLGWPLSWLFACVALSLGAFGLLMALSLTWRNWNPERRTS